MERNKIVLVLLSFVFGALVATAVYSNMFLLKCTMHSSVTSHPPVLNPTIKHPELTNRTIPVVAVNQFSNEGVVGNLTIRLIPGNSNVLIETNPFLETDLQYSANIAITVAKLATGKLAPKRDFVLSYEIPGQVIGGGSAGAATTIAAIAAIENRTLKPGVVITGTINQDGTIGPVGGILEKAKAVADAGFKVFLVPAGQTKVRYYEKLVTTEPFGFGIRLYNTRYVPRLMDIRKEAEKEWGLKIIEVGTIKEAMKYMLE